MLGTHSAPQSPSNSAATESPPRTARSHPEVQQLTHHDDAAGATRGMVRKAVELAEDRWSRQLRRLQLDVNEVRELTLNFLEQRTAQVEKQLSKLERRCAELSGNCTGLSEEMQAQIRYSQQLDTRLRDARRQRDEDMRSKCMELDLKIQKVSTCSNTTLGSIEDSMLKQGQRLQALELSIENGFEQFSRTNTQHLRQASAIRSLDLAFEEADVDPAIQLLANDVQKVLAAVSEQNTADLEIRSEMAHFRDDLSKKGNDMQHLTKELAQVLQRLDELPKCQTQLQALETEQPRSLSQPRSERALSTGSQLPVSVSPEVRKWSKEIEARLGTLEAGETGQKAQELNGSERTLSNISAVLDQHERSKRDLTKKVKVERSRAPAGADEGELHSRAKDLDERLRVLETPWLMNTGPLNSHAPSEDSAGAALQSLESRVRELEGLKASHDHLWDVHRNFSERFDAQARSGTLPTITREEVATLFKEVAAARSDVDLVQRSVRSVSHELSQLRRSNQEVTRGLHELGEPQEEPASDKDQSLLVSTEVGEELPVPTTAGDEPSVAAERFLESTVTGDAVPVAAKRLAQVRKEAEQLRQRVSEVRVQTKRKPAVTARLKSHYSGKELEKEAQALQSRLKRLATVSRGTDHLAVPAQVAKSTTDPTGRPGSSEEALLDLPQPQEAARAQEGEGNGRLTALEGVVRQLSNRFDTTLASTREGGRSSAEDPTATNLSERVTSLESLVDAVSESIFKQAEKHSEQCTELAKDLSSLENHVTQIAGHWDFQSREAGIDGTSMDHFYIGT